MHLEHPPVIVLPDALSDETAVQLLELLHEIARAVEDRYAAQIHRHRHRGDDRQPDLWDGQNPPF